MIKIPPQFEDIDRTAQDYLNRRVDSMETNMQIGFDRILDAMKENNARTLDSFKTCQKNCKDNIQELKENEIALENKVSSLNLYKNRAIGAAGIIAFFLGIWKIG